MKPWIPIILSLKDPSDYDEFAKACILAGDDKPVSPFEYAQRLGLFMVATRRFKGVTPEEAYWAFQEERKSSGGGCGSCGGKKSS